MRIFRDSSGQAWTIPTFTWEIVGNVLYKSRFTIDLNKPETLKSENYELPLCAIWLLIESQAEERDVSAEQFLAADVATHMQALSCFYHELASYFKSLKQFNRWLELSRIADLLSSAIRK